jgi:hypothetical protein
VTTPYDPQYGAQQGGAGYGQPGVPGSEPGFAGGQAGGDPGFAGGQTGYPGGQTGYQGGQTGYQGAYPGYPGPGTQPGPGQPGPAQPGFGQPGFAAVNQLPGESLVAVARKRAIRQLLIGLGIFVVGLIITIATISAASSGGGTYVVAYGPMIVGILWTIRALVTLSKLNKLR